MRLSNIQWLFLLFIFGQLNIQLVKSSWPIPNSSSSIEILGLFSGETNASVTSKFIIHSRAMFKAAIILSQRYNITIDGQFLQWQIVHTNGTAITALSETCDAVINSTNTIGIVGPALSREVPIIADFGNRIGVPVISYAATDPSLSDQNNYPAFHRTVPSDNAAALAIVQLFLRYNWSSCVIIYQNDAYGLGGLKAISEAFINRDLTVEDTLMFDIGTLQMRNNLKHSLMTSPTRIVLAWVDSPYLPFILQDALESDVIGPNFMWILSSSIPFTSFNRTSSEKLIGMLTVEPIIANVLHAQINRTLLNAAYEIWETFETETYPGYDKVDYYALFTFDAVWLLVQSLQKFCSQFRNNNNSLSCISFTKSTSCFKHHFHHSSTFLNIINQMKFLGTSGLVEFNENTTDRINGSYYFVQNARLLSNGLQFVPVLNYSDQYGWQEYSGGHVIIWPDGSLEPPTGGAKLEGANLKIGVIISPPFASIRIVKNEYGHDVTSVIGYMPDVIDILKKKINFKGDIQLISISPNQTYASAVLGIKNGLFDILLGDVTVTSGRSEQVNFITPIFDNCLTMIMRKTNDVYIDLFLFVRPFSLELWFVLLSVVFVASVLLCLIEKDGNEVLQNKSKIFICTMSIWYVFGNMLGYGVDFHVHTSAGRFLTFGLYIVSIVSVAGYTANLSSELTRLKSKNMISSIDDIKSGMVRSNRIGIIVGTAIEDYYLREISRGIRDFYPLKSLQDAYDCLINNEIDVAFHDIGTAEYIVNNIYCNLTLVGECFDKSSFGILTPKKWLFRQDLSVHLLRLAESGVFDSLKRKWFTTRICADSSEQFTAIGIETFGGLFIVFSIISCLTLVLVLRKFLLARLRRRMPIF